MNDAPVGAPVILDAPANPVVGSPLSVDVSQITDEDGLGTLSIQWQRNGVHNITGATNATFTPLLAHAGGTLRVRVTFTDQHGTVETLFSESTGAVEAPPIAIASCRPRQWTSDPEPGHRAHHQVRDRHQLRQCAACR